jgi:hypothetical protein
MKILYNLFLIMFLIVAQISEAQESNNNGKIVQGIVTDFYTGDPLIGTSVYVKGTTIWY